VTDRSRPGPLTVVVLAAGEGTRMVSATAKVLHGFAGRSLLGHVLAAAAPLGAAETAVVVGHQRDQVTEHLRAIAADAHPVVQDEQRGTGHAVRLALHALPNATGTVLVLPGDTPLLTTQTLSGLLDAHHAAHARATMLTAVVADPTGYGRVIRGTDGSVARVVEHADAAPDELAVAEVAAGVYAFDAARLREAVRELSSDNAQGEEYLPDAVSVLVGAGDRVTAVLADAAETAGVNDRVQLSTAYWRYNARLLEAHMRAGVTVVDTASTWVDATVTLEPDVTLLPSVQLCGSTSIAAGARIGPEVTLTDTVVGARAVVTRAVANSARVGTDVTVGPYAYLRPGTVLADGVHIGTYVEVKNSEIGTGSKVPHLSYVGDATIGEHTNIGAATVFVNYDGVAKHRSSVGDHARTGADTMFVAPVHVGDGAYTAAGSVITQDVPPGAMGVARAQQRNVEGWVHRRRAGTPSDEAAARATRGPDAAPEQQPGNDTGTGDGS
jgi:bifunctional UDP-N-acetylglucosamine pyrophosphorylase / glucosamine-1-phosphate N-acetyltransferase